MSTLRRYELALEAILAMHYENEHGECAVCALYQDYPCKTARRVLEAYSQTERDPVEDIIDAAREHGGGWSAETLNRWGVPWPPPKGWRQRLIDHGIPYLANDTAVLAREDMLKRKD